MKEFKGVQADILNAKKKNQLVSAGAGSGKTTVMIEKISNMLIRDKVDVSSLLVVTFTVLAAQEMKERLIKNLKEVILTASDEEKAESLQLIEKIETASIDTIDGFASKTIKKYFYDLEISPNVEIISDATKDYYLTRAMTKTFNDYEKSNGEINLMLDLFGGNKRNLETLQDLILKSYNNIINIEDYEKFLQDCVCEYSDSVKSENIVNSYICEMANKTLSDVIEEYETLTDKVKTKLQVILDKLNQFNSKMSFKTNLKILLSFETIRFAPKDYSENENLKVVTKIIGNFNEIKKEIIANQIDENYEEKNEKIINYLNIFINLLKNFINNYNNIKKNNNLIDFNDLNRLMLKLLKNKKVCDELKNKYKYIFIDEYQDVNPLQDSLMTLLTGDDTTVFMVGDVKQSIYGFRGSSPEWFLAKYDRMKKDQQNEDVFDMNINFRSSPTILNFINVVFSQLMTKHIADIDYKNDCMIEPQRDDIVDDKVKIMLINEPEEEYVDKGIYSVKNHQQIDVANAKNKEAMLVTKIITELVGKEFYDANAKQRRKLNYGDIAILTHSDKDENSTLLVETLRSHSIPVNQNNKLEIDTSETVRLVLSILKCVCNTGDDVDYMATFLSLTDITIDEIVSFRDKNFSFYENLLIIKENLIENNIFSKINLGFSILEEIKNASYSKTNRELISYILNQKKLRYYILQKSNGEKELQFLEEFLSKLSPVEDALGIAEFVEVVESNVSSSGDFTVVDKEDSVTLQTIHKSKGLEYPVVILYNSSKLFSYLREKDAITFNSNLGFGLDYFDVANRMKMDSLVKYAIKISNNKKGYKEEMRLLYVALTRAKNKLFITGTTNKKFEDINKTSYTNMLLSCFCQDIQDDRLERETFELEIVDDVDLDNEKSVETGRVFEVIGQDFEYPNKEKFIIPFKNTVTGINSKFTQEQSFKVKSIINANEQYEIEDRAKVGVEYHLALEKLNLENSYEKNTDLDLVDYKKIELAHKVLSPLAIGAVSIKKESEFMMYVPYSDVVLGGVDDKILIQGVVDLIIEKEDHVVLVDYKFSSLPAKVLKEKYAEQLNLYKIAIEEAFKKPVKEMFIYSINTGELV